MAPPRRTQIFPMAAPPTALCFLALVTAMTPFPAPGQVGTPPDPGQRVVLITGSTSGLGRSVARALAGAGDHVIVHGRNEERGRALVEEINGTTSGSARFYRADFGSLDQVRTVASAILRDYPRLDVLVNNAGVAFAADRQRRLSEDGYELTFQVNYLAHFLLTELLLPRLRTSTPARIVNVSSVAAAPLDFDDLMLEEGYEGWRAYGQSKLAQVMHTLDLARELEGTDVRVNALHPATFMDTNLLRLNGLQPRTSVEEGRDHVLLLIDGDVGSGDFYIDGKPVRARSAQAYDVEARAKLRAVSLRLVGEG